jgi:hypothetical protein
VDAAEVVEHEIERNRVDVVVELLGEGVGQAREPAQDIRIARFWDST